MTQTKPMMTRQLRKELLQEKSKRKALADYLCIVVTQHDMDGVASKKIHSGCRDTFYTYADEIAEILGVKFNDKQ